MSKTILYVEDNSSMRKYTVELLKSAGYKVVDRQRIDQVKEYFNEYYKEIDCIITDLNMADEWLEKYRHESDGCMISGWVWLQHYVFNSHPEIPAIIYSGYNQYLRNILKVRDTIHLLDKEDLYLVDKGADKFEGFQRLNSKLKEIFSK